MTDVAAIIRAAALRTLPSGHSGVAFSSLCTDMQEFPGPVPGEGKVFTVFQCSVEEVDYQNGDCTEVGVFFWHYADKDDAARASAMSRALVDTLHGKENELVQTAYGMYLAGEANDVGNVQIDESGWLRVFSAFTVAVREI